MRPWYTETSDSNVFMKRESKIFEEIEVRRDHREVNVFRDEFRSLSRKPGQNGWGDSLLLR